MPNLPLMAHHRRQPKGPHQRVGCAPKLAVQLSKRLRHPSREREVIKPAKYRGIFLP